MLLQPLDAVRRLIALEPGAARAVTTTGVTVDLTSRKNHSIRVRAGSNAIVLKQARLAEDDCIEREAEIYRILWKARSARGVRSFLPKRLAYDSDRRVLVLEYVTCTANLRDYHGESLRFPVMLGRRLGTALRAVHTVDVGDVVLADVVPLRPWVLQLTAPDINMLRTESAGTLEVLRTVQTSSRICGAIESAAADWSYDALCHNDVRLDNVLWRGPSGKRIPGVAAVYFVDWELASPGFAAWDIACLFAGYVELWISSIDPGQPTRHRTNAISARFPMSVMHALIRAAWRSYASEHRAADPPSPSSLARLVGLRLVQSALEWAQRSLSPPAQSSLLLEAAEKFVSHPLEGWVHVLGLPLARR